MANRRDRVIDGLRAVFGIEREERAKADSPSVAAQKQHVPSMFSVWGREDVGGLLTVSQSLMDRFADNEAMEEYPDINCLAEGSIIYVVEGSVVTPTKIEQLVMSGEQPTILAYDTKKKKIVCVQAQNPRMTGRDVDVVEIALANGKTLRVTANHKLLTLERGYRDAEKISAGDVLIGTFGGTATSEMSVLVEPRPGVVEVRADPCSGGKARVFDITTETHNFICEGAVVHNSAYHYFANDATQPNVKDGKAIWVTAEDGAMAGIGNDLLHEVLRVEDEVWSQAYTLGMYGNLYEEQLITENGVIGLNTLPVPTVRRVERLDGGLIGFVQDVTGQFTANGHELRRMLAGTAEIPKSLALFEDWQVAHFRLQGTRRRSPYGVSLAEGARWIWKRLVMLEDSVLIYKLTRAPARYAYYIDVTDVPSDRVEGFLKKMKRDLKKKKMVDPRTGRLTMRYNPLARDEDFFIGVREGRELARVEVLAGPDYQAIDDVEYFKRMLHGTLGVPKDYLGQEGAIPSKSILSNDDVRAARRTMNLQRAIRLGYERIVRTHLAARGIKNPWQPKLQVEMTVPSGIWELAAYEMLNARADYASRVMQWTSTRYIQENILKLSDDEIAAIEKEQKADSGEEQAGDLPSYAMPAGGVETGEEPGQEGGPPPEGAQQAPEKKAPEKPKTPEEWRAYTRAKRLEERRYVESSRRHHEIMDRLGNLMENDKAFARREKRRQGFFEDIRRMALRKDKAGRVSALPGPRPGRRPAHA